MLLCWDNDSTFWITSRVHILCLLVDISLPCLLLFWSGGDKKSTAPLFSSVDSGTWHILSVAYSFFILQPWSSKCQQSKDPDYNCDFKNLCRAKQSLTWYWPECHCMQSLGLCFENDVKNKQNKIKNCGNKCCVFSSRWTGTLFLKLNSRLKIKKSMASK